MALKFYSYLYLCHFHSMIIFVSKVNMWHPNAFGYLFIEICDIQIYLNVCSCPFYDICLLLPPPLVADKICERPLMRNFFVLNYFYNKTFFLFKFCEPIFGWEK